MAHRFILPPVVVGDKIGAWTVLAKAEPTRRKGGGYLYFWSCRCDCKTERRVSDSSLRQRTSMSCGCGGEIKPRRYVHRHKLEVQTERECRVCGERKPLAEGHFSPHNKNGYRHVCTLCEKFNKKIAKYGITRPQYDAMAACQDGLCWICKGVNADGRVLFVDHCHDTHRIRGLLCTTCNLAVGYLRDDPALARRLAEYLECTAGSAVMPTAGSRLSCF